MVIKESLSPEIGPFYVIDGVVYGDTDDVRDIETSPLGMKDSTRTHYDYWKALSRVYPEYRRLDYDYFPRGRIVYNVKTKEYKVYADPCILANESVKDSIIDEFNLPRNNTKFDTDEHYQCHSCNKEYVDISENYEGD